MKNNYSFVAYILSFIVLTLFLLLGTILTISFLQSLFMGLSGVGLTSILFFIIGIYLVYRPIMHIRFLIKNKNNFDKIYGDFIKENKIAIIIAAVLSIIFLSLFYTNTYLNFDFFVNAVLFLPIFLLNNLVFIVNISLLRFKLQFLAPIIDLILPISQIIYLFIISKFIAKFIKKKK